MKFSAIRFCRLESMSLSVGPNAVSVGVARVLLGLRPRCVWEVIGSCESIPSVRAEVTTYQPIRQPRGNVSLLGDIGQAKAAPI